MTKRVGKMRVKCPECGGKAAIYTRPKVTDGISNIYARCKNPSCDRSDHAFVSQLSFSHWVDPTAEAFQMTMDFIMDNLTPDQRQAILAKYSGAA